MSKVAIFVDYDNVYDTIEKKYNKDESIDIHTRFFENLWDKFKDNDICKFIAFADYTKVNKKNLITELQKRSVKLEHCYSNGAKEEYRKNASDLALCISVMKSVYELDIDTYVLVSSDCDMIPILNELKFRNKRAIHVFSPTSANKDIKEYTKDKKWSVVDDFYSIEDILQVELYVDSVSELSGDDFADIVKKSLPYIFQNMVDQRKKKNEYGFGYLISDIKKVVPVKEDAQKIATKVNDLKIVLPLPDEIVTDKGSFPNLRLNAEHDWVKEILGTDIKEENDDIFIKE